MAKVPEKLKASLSRQIIRPCTVFTSPDVDQFDDISGTLATPLVQVFAVEISTNFDEGKPCEIYGSIRVMEGPYHRFDLYDRNPEDSETVWKEGTLSLFGPVDGAIVPSLNTTLDICLMDRIRGVEVVRGEVNLDPLTEDSYDCRRKGRVECANGSAFVYYTVLKLAVYGSVEVIVNTANNVANKFDVTDIYGSVVAVYENGRRYCSADDDVKCMEIGLFDKPSDRPLRVLVGKPIPLSRNVVAVPAYSTLKIQLNLWNSNGQIADACLDFPVHFVGLKPFYIDTEYACVTVNVPYNNAYRHLYRDRKVDNCHVANSSKVEEVQKKRRVLLEENISASIVPITIPKTKNIRLYLGKPKAEVFTIFVDGINDKISALYGSIIIDDGDKNFSIYTRDESCAEMLQDHSLASIEFNHRAIRNTEFYIILNLRDPVSKLEMSNGYVCWNACLLFNRMSFKNIQMCSVVRGKHGYAAVHHAVFDFAFEAFVEVKLFQDDCLDIPINLYGTLFARYSGYDYSTSYKENYYRSRLLDLPQNGSVQLESGSKIALLKSKVVVPAGSSLQIEAKLVVLGCRNAYEAISGMEEFNIDLGGTIPKEIKGEHCRIVVYVTFER